MRIAVRNLTKAISVGRAVTWPRPRLRCRLSEPEPPALVSDQPSCFDIGDEPQSSARS